MAVQFTSKPFVSLVHTICKFLNCSKWFAKYQALLDISRTRNELKLPTTRMWLVRSGYKQFSCNLFSKILSCAAGLETIVYLSQLGSHWQDNSHDMYTLNCAEMVVPLFYSH